MKVFVGFDDPTALDLVAHFLGIAVHHNDNVAPSAISAPKRRAVLLPTRGTDPDRTLAAGSAIATPSGRTAPWATAHRRQKA